MKHILRLHRYIWEVVECFEHEKHYSRQNDETLNTSKN